MKLEYTKKDNQFSNVKEVLKSHFRISDRLLTKLKKNQYIYLNNEPTFVHKEIFLGDKISVNLNFEEKSENIVPRPLNLDILFEDNFLLVVNKPANMPVHPSILHFEDSLSNGIQFYFNSKKIKKKIRPVNRLDKNTSGIVIFAKNEYIQECLINQMKSNTFQKEYYAILEGYIEEKLQTINAPISRKGGSIIEREINKNGDQSITHLEMIKNFEINSLRLSFVKLILETGRTHQIRVHSKYIGHSILGDSLYGSASELINRQALHAYKVTFIHPISNETIIIECPLPKDMEKIIIK